MTKTLSMVSHKKYHLNANEGFVIPFTSKLITWFISGLALKMNSQSIAYWLNGSEHIYWIWDLEGEVHSIWDLWISGLQDCKDNGFFFKLGGRATIFGRIQKMLIFWTCGCPCPNIPPPESLWGGGELNILHMKLIGMLSWLSIWPKNILLSRACFFRSQGEHVHDRCTYIRLSIL
jgi:hypothetical protein